STFTLASCRVAGRCGARLAGPEGVGDGSEAEFGQEATQPIRRAMQAAVMTDPREPRHADARLPRVQLPGVDVEGAGHALLLGLPERGPDDAVGEEPEIGAAAGRDVHAPAAKRGRRELGQAAGRAGQPVDVPLRRRVAVAGSLNREEARVVAVPLLDQDVERPFDAGRDGEARRAEAPDRLAADVLEHLLALPHGLSEPLRSLLCHATMVPPVRRDLVA